MFDWLPLRRRRPPTAVPPNWAQAVEGALEHVSRRYNLEVVGRDLQGEGKRFPVFKIEFFREVAKRL